MANCSNAFLACLFVLVNIYVALSFMYTGGLVLSAPQRTLPSGGSPDAAKITVAQMSPLEIATRGLAAVLDPIFNYWGRSLLPVTNGTLELQGLKNDVHVHRDKWGIPHLYASNHKDLFMAQGYIHAQDRLWQMFVNRLVATGSLSKVFGEGALDADKYSRMLGFRRLGVADYKWAKEHQPREATMLEAYCRGINAFLNDVKKGKANLPIEFKILRIAEVETWKPEHVASWGRMMGFSLAEGWNSEIIRQVMTKAVGKEAAEEWENMNIFDKDHTAQVKTAGEFNHQDAAALRSKEIGPFFNTKRGWGSNAWTVSGKKTKTGKPLLANDPHLVLSSPSIWYMMHLHAPAIEKFPEYHVFGVSMPGLPMVMIGHNDHVAWGITVSMSDHEDVFVEEFDGLKYKTKDGWKEATVHDEVIEIKGKEPIVHRVVETHHGPLFSELLKHSKENVSIASSTLKHSPSFRGFYHMNMATNWDEFASGVESLETTTLNIVYSDVEGNIGYYAAGKIPMRSVGDGSQPIDGTGSAEYKGYVPFEEQPWAVNPQTEMVVSANNKIVDDTYKHRKDLGRNFVNGFRAQRIEQMINSVDKVDSAFYEKMQQDVTSIPGKKFTELIAGHLTSKVLDELDNDKVKLATHLLKTWNFEMDRNSIGATVYSVAKHFMLRTILETTLDADMADLMLGKGLIPLLKPTTEYYGHDTVTLLTMLEKNMDSFWMNKAGGAVKVLNTSFIHTIEWLQRELGEDENDWRWGYIHLTNFPHALGRSVRLFDLIFSRTAGCIGGDTDTVQQTAQMPGSIDYHNKNWSPSYRQIIDLSDVSKTRVMYGPGQSGQLGSENYDDLAPMYAQGKYIIPAWHRSQVIKETKNKLVFKPQ